MLERLRTKLLPEAVKAQAFGIDVRKFVSFEPKTQETVIHFGSEIIFGDITVQKENCELLTESVVIKLQTFTEVTNSIKDSNAEFHNEVLFYTKIVPLLRRYDTNDILSRNFCEFIYGKATNGKNRLDDMLILKDLNKKGFKMAEEKVFIDEKHVKLALNEIAKYHALSLISQWNDPREFHEVVSQIKRVINPYPKDFIKRSTFRGINALREDPQYKDKLAAISANCENADHWMLKYMEPSEQISVITHGDFFRNNMMFKYNSKGNPVEVVFFDLAYIRFCSPTIDTSFLLLFNTLQETRRLHWDDFLRTYFDTLSKQLEGCPVEATSESTEFDRYVKSSFESVKLDWRTKGIYGYYFASAFQPLWLFPQDYEKECQKTTEVVTDADEAALLMSIITLGGTEATENLAEIVKHMLDEGYIFEH